MFAVRCLECGDTRWALSRASFEHLVDDSCEACGGKVVPERRRPGASPRKAILERRDHHEEAASPPNRLAGV
jgi:hypothetical protein